MDSQQNLDYFKECYYHEFDHKDKINNRVAIPAGIVPILAASDIYLINNLKDIGEYWKLWAVLFVIVYSVTLFGTLFYIFRTLYNHKYGYTATPQRIYDYKKSLENSGIYSEEVIKAEMLDYLSSEFAKYATLNRKSNLSKIFYLRVVYYWIIAALIAGLLCIPAYTFGKNKDSEVSKVQIVNSIKKGGASNE
ncbi:hypothetical protein [Priestia megaterium]|uniref:hypothetical protein n=1 Tax=Priestia megaterium TaxID=1404 RepID=UPI0039E973FA